MRSTVLWDAEKRALVGGGAARAVLQPRKIEVNDPRILGNSAMNRGQPRRSSAMEHDINLRLQGEDGRVGHIAEPYRGPLGLGKAELALFHGSARSPSSG